MGVISVAGLLDNIEKSLDRYISDTIESQGIRAHLHQTYQFIPPESDAWLQVNYDLLAQNRRFYRQVNATEIGDEIVGLIDLSIMQHWRDWTGRFTLSDERDIVKAQFPTSGIIPVLDFTDVNEPRVGSIYINEVTERLVDGGIESGIIQYTITVEVRYIEAYTR